MAELTIGEYVSAFMCPDRFPKRFPSVSRYTLECKLKAGSAAEVHLGRHVKTQQQVAVKIFTSKACSKDTELSALVAAEIEAAKVTSPPFLASRCSSVLETGAQTQAHCQSS